MTAHVIVAEIFELCTMFFVHNIDSPICSLVSSDVVESESEDSEEGGSDYDEDLMTDGETNASSSVSRQNKPKSERREAR